jgi:hypothetical protein
MLAAVCDGDVEPIKALVVDRSANEYGRSAGVTALALLAAWAEVPRESIVAWFLWLAQEGLEREPSQVRNSLAAGSADIEALPLFPRLRRAYADGLIEPRFMNPSELDDVEAAPRGSVLKTTRERYPPIDDVVEATAWWGRFGRVTELAATGEPSRPAPKSAATNHVPGGAARSSRSAAAVDARQDRGGAQSADCPSSYEYRSASHRIEEQTSGFAPGRSADVRRVLQ